MKEGVERAFQVVERGYKAGVYGAAAAALGRRGEAPRLRVWGGIGPGGSGPRVTARSPFDLASLTKPLATARAFHILSRRGLLFAQDRVGYFLPRARSPHRDLTLAQLLSHSSGLPPWTGLYHKGGRGDLADFARRVLATDLVARPGRKVAYSCMGYILLSRILEVVSGLPYRLLVKKEILEPLGWRDGDLPLPGRMRSRAVVTEVSPLRGKLIQGETHDENSWHCGGTAGNAGLFGSIRDVAGAAKLWLEDPVPEALPCVTEGLNERRSRGWFLKGPGSGFLGTKTTKSAYGHTGFTGTSMVVDPELGFYAVLLTNRVHPDRNRAASRELFPIRAAFADAAAEWARSQKW